MSRGRIKVNLQPANDCWFCATGRHRECTQDKTQVRQEITGRVNCGCWVRNGKPRGRHSDRVRDDGDAIINILGNLGGK